MTTPEKHPLEILAPDGPHETILAAKEQAAPVADVAAFAEVLKGFSREDYCGDAPYDLLVRSSQYAWNQFDQFAAVLLDAAVKTGMDKKDVREAVALFRYLYVESAGEASGILSVPTTSSTAMTTTTCSPTILNWRSSAPTVLTAWPIWA